MVKTVPLNQKAPSQFRLLPWVKQPQAGSLANPEVPTATGLSTHALNNIDYDFSGTYSLDRGDPMSRSNNATSISALSIPPTLWLLAAACFGLVSIIRPSESPMFKPDRNESAAAVTSATR